MIVRCGLGELGLIAGKCVLDCTKSLREDARLGGGESNWDKGKEYLALRREAQMLGDKLGRVGRAFFDWVNCLTFIRGSMIQGEKGR